MIMRLKSVGPVFGLLCLVSCAVSPPASASGPPSAPETQLEEPRMPTDNTRDRERDSTTALLTRLSKEATATLIGQVLSIRDDALLRPRFVGPMLVYAEGGEYRVLEPSRCKEKVCIRDSWGNPIRFGLPGPVHDWDFWSFGANGIDEQGKGDDLVVGDTVASVESWR